MATRDVSKSFTFEQQRQEINSLSQDVGDVASLVAGGNTNLVSAVNNLYVNGGGGGSAGAIGTPTDGSYTNNTYGVTLQSTTTVADAVDGINTLLGKILPSKPPTVSNLSLDLTSSSFYRYCSGVTGLDNGLTSLPGSGSTIKVIRLASYTTQTLDNIGPADSGTVVLTRNGSSVGTRILTQGSDAGTYGELVLLNDVDYSTVASIPAGVWYSYDAYATGTSTAGWNALKISQFGLDSQTLQWFYDTGAPGAPTISSIITDPVTTNYNYSSGIAHYSQSNTFQVALTLGKLSGNTFPSSNNFITSTTVPAFTTILPITYANASITLPLARNYLSASTINYTANLSLSDTHTSSSTFPTFTVDNSYLTTNHTPSYAKTILVKGGTPSTSKVDEQNIVIQTGIGSGTGSAVRVSSGSNADTPANIWSASAVNFSASLTATQLTTTYAYEAIVTGGTLRHDQTNYSVNYIPTGPNLSTARTGSQYFTFKFNRQGISNFPLKINSTSGIAGLWITSNISSLLSFNSSTNGWVTPTALYNGTGVPINGCAVGSVVPLNTALNNTVVNCTFGTESSSNSGTNDIFVRVKLNSGQSVSFISISNT